MDKNSGIFEVANAKGYSYTVNLTIPSCSCPDWTEYHYPCKHFFAIFNHRCPIWDWNALPQEYLSSPRLSLGTRALEHYFSQEDIQFDALQSENNVQEMGDATPKRKVHATNNNYGNYMTL